MKTQATDIKTIFTQIGGSQEFYQAHTWVKIKLRLETAGPVSVSTRSEIEPVLGGAGGLLNDVDMEFILSKGDRLYYTAQAVNRFRMISQPMPVIETVVVPALEENSPPPAPLQAQHPRRKPAGKPTRWP